MLFRVEMPDPAMEAVVEVEGVQFTPWCPAPGGAKEAAVSVTGNAFPFHLPVRHPSGCFGDRLGSRPDNCGSAARSASVTDDTALEVVCFNACGRCLGCTDPFAINYNPLADLTHRTACAWAQGREDAPTRRPRTTTHRPYGTMVLVPLNPWSRPAQITMGMVWLEWETC